MERALVELKLQLEQLVQAGIAGSVPLSKRWIAKIDAALGTPIEKEERHG